MVGFGWKAMILNIGNVLSFNSGNAIAGISRGAEVASVYYTSQMPALTGYNILTRLPDNAAPAINQLYGQEDVIALKKSFLRLVRLVLFLSLPLSVYISIFNHDLIVTWVGDKQYGGSLLSISLGVFCFIAPIQRLFVVYSFCFNFMKELIITALVQGVGNILLAFYFSNVFGIGGIALSLVVVSIPQLLVLSSKVSSALKISMSFVVCNIMMRLVGPILLAVIATFWFHCINMFIYKSYLVTVVEAIIFLFVYIVCSYVVYFNVDERAIIKKVFRFGLR
jgi:O-antigen/teichoic acid export membrane protein